MTEPLDKLATLLPPGSNLIHNAISRLLRKSTIIRTTVRDCVTEVTLHMRSFAPNINEYVTAAFDTEYADKILEPVDLLEVPARMEFECKYVLEWDSAGVVTSDMPLLDEILWICLDMIDLPEIQSRELTVFFADYHVSPPLIIPRTIVVTTCAEQLHLAESINLDIAHVTDSHVRAVTSILEDRNMMVLLGIEDSDFTIVVSILTGLGTQLRTRI